MSTCIPPKYCAECGAQLEEVVPGYYDEQTGKLRQKGTPWLKCPVYHYFYVYGWGLWGGKKWRKLRGGDVLGL
jgi:hypothetical protein